jgi:hypothetical protein
MRENAASFLHESTSRLLRCYGPLIKSLLLLTPLRPNLNRFILSCKQRASGETVNSDEEI